MNELQSALNEMFGHRPRRQPKTELWLVYEGKASRIYRKGQYWRWRHPLTGSECGDSHLSMVVHEVEGFGGKVERRPIKGTR